MSERPNQQQHNPDAPNTAPNLKVNDHRDYISEMYNTPGFSNALALGCMPQGSAPTPTARFAASKDSSTPANPPNHPAPTSEEALPTSEEAQQLPVQAKTSAVAEITALSNRFQDAVRRLKEENVQTENQHVSVKNALQLEVTKLTERETTATKKLAAERLKNIVEKLHLKNELAEVQEKLRQSEGAVMTLGTEKDALETKKRELSDQVEQLKVGLYTTLYLYNGEKAAKMAAVKKCDRLELEIAELEESKKQSDIAHDWAMSHLGAELATMTENFEKEKSAKEQADRAWKAKFNNKQKEKDNASKELEKVRGMLERSKDTVKMMNDAKVKAADEKRILDTKYTKLEQKHKEMEQQLNKEKKAKEAIQKEKSILDSKCYKLEQKHKEMEKQLNEEKEAKEAVEKEYADFQSNWKDFQCFMNQKFSAVPNTHVQKNGATKRKASDPANDEDDGKKPKHTQKHGDDIEGPSTK